ncbi:pyrrolo-quinoline quinone [bacterium]|nr:pyrrolo-quinoline quinone [bacterium]
MFVTDYVTAADVKIANFERKSSTGTERVLCLDETTGRILWKHEYPVTYTIAYPAGPRCTPTVDGDRVYTLGAEGNLVCFAAATGRILWSRDLKKDYATKAALWGWASHPLVDGERLICIAGTDAAHAIALDKLTGDEIWRAGKAPEQGYVPPSLIEAAGVRQLVLVKPDGVYAVEPETGKLLWETPYAADNGSIIMTPVRAGDYLYIGGYQNKNLLLKLKGDVPGVEVVWRNKPKQGISAVNVQPIVADGLVYGFHESGELRAMRLPDGDFAWRGGGPLGGRPQGSGTAFITRHGDRFFLFAETGDLVIAKLTPAGYEELSRAHLLEPTNVAFGRPVVWCPPAYANRSIIVRNDAELIRVSLAK